MLAASLPIVGQVSAACHPWGATCFGEDPPPDTVVGCTAYFDTDDVEGSANCYVDAVMANQLSIGAATWDPDTPNAVAGTHGHVDVTIHRTDASGKKAFWYVVKFDDAATGIAWAGATQFNKSFAANDTSTQTLRLDFDVTTDASVSDSLIGYAVWDSELTASSFDHGWLGFHIHSGGSATWGYLLAIVAILGGIWAWRFKPLGP